MRILTIALSLMLPGLAGAQGVTRVERPSRDQLLYLRTVGVLAAGTIAGWKAPPDRAIVLTRLTAYISGASGGGAGSTTIRVSDGTNNCDAVLPCASTNSTGPKDAAFAGACSFAPGAALTLSCTATTCTTTQPTAQTLDIHGY